MRPKGEQWHIELLRQMTLDIPEIRPPVLTSEIAEQLDEYRKFRHLIRNIYTINIVPQRLAEIVLPLSSLWTQVREALLRFAEYLDEVAPT